MFETIIGILLIVMAVFLVIAVLMQSSKDHRLGASIAGGAETFFGKTKGKSLDALFSKLTTIIAIIFVILVVVLYVVQDDLDDYMAGLEVPEASDEAGVPADDEAEAETPVEGEGEAEAPAEGEGEAEAPAEGEGEAEAPAEGEGEAEAPVEGEETPAE